MSNVQTEEKVSRPDGFEIDGEFFRWRITDKGKDLILIDRLTGGMPPHEFFALIEERFDLERGPMLLAMMATSIRASRPDWSPERILNLVYDTNLSDIEFVGTDEEERTDVDGPLPPTEEGQTSPSPAEESSSSPTPAESSESETSSATPPPSGDPGSDTSTD